mgnify:FL=1
MKSNIPKQFLNLKEEPILLHTLKKFQDFCPNSNIIITINKNYISYWKEICEKLKIRNKYKLVVGGETRFHSVQNSLKLIKSNSIVAIHDGVRPMFTKKLIYKLFDKIKKHDCVIPYISTNDTVKVKGIKVNRKELMLIQTPQLFKGNVIKKAYKQKHKKIFTDDSSVVESIGHKIKYVKGELENIKITTIEDLKIIKKII